MEKLFAISAGSIVGREHLGREGLLTGKNNQDAFDWLGGEKCLVGVVCDGCSEMEHSGFGAELGARVFVKELFLELNRHTSEPDFNAVLAHAQRRVISHLRAATRTLAVLESDFTATVEDYLLFTVVGFMMTPKQTAIFSLGDGLFGINDEVTRLGPFADNQPPYMGFHLYPSKPAQFDSIDIQIQKSLPTAEIEALFIGTDGCIELNEKAKELLPDGSGPIGPIQQFMKERRFAENPLAIPRYLRRVNSELARTRSVDSATGSTVQAQFVGGHLSDDTTLLVVQRKPQPPALPAKKSLFSGLLGKPGGVQ